MGLTLMGFVSTPNLAQAQGVAPEYMHVVAPWSDFQAQRYRFADYVAYFPIPHCGPSGSLRSFVMKQAYQTSRCSGRRNICLSQPIPRAVCPRPSTKTVVSKKSSVKGQHDDTGVCTDNSSFCPILRAKMSCAG